MDELLEKSIKLKGSLLEFTRIFYLLRTGRKFELSNPLGRESHYITICRALTRVFNGDCKRLVINVPPRYGKTELLIHFVAWSLAQYPDSHYIYVSYAHHLAKRQTQTIKNIITLQQYKDLFGVKLRDDTQAKDNFYTTAGGFVYGVGACGAITGIGAGINRSERFGGCIVIDDIHKPNEATSDTIREGINDWYYNTLQSRLNSTHTPIIFIGQRVHEDDLAGHVLFKEEDWERLVLPALDASGNALYPELHDLSALRQIQEASPYHFAAQYQQDPQPSGGGIFKPEWFRLHDIEPLFKSTFITVDTAETDKDYNDATVFHFWGVYDIDLAGIDTDLLALHSIDCLELRVEPKDLEREFMNFYRRCMLHSTKPRIVGIERKSTGTTLASSLKAVQGLRVIDINRTKASGCKTERFLSIQPYIANGHVSLPTYGKHTPVVLEHMRKITANDTHRFDDICDTIYDAVKLALIDKVITGFAGIPKAPPKGLYNKLNTLQRLRGYNTTVRLPTFSPFGKPN